MPETTRTPVFTRYEILEELGSGGMGTVYKARQKFVGRLVAFKVLPPALRQDAEALQRFEREAAALGRLKHPNVVAVFDAGVEGGFPYLAMEFVQGKNLRQVLQERGRLSVDEALRLGIEMAEALEHVQRRGLVHRDVKPSNILIDPDGKAMLTDFGIAFAATLPRITQGAMGTPEFMSPEQADGRALDIRSDLYSLGVVLYEGLAGAVPFKREGDSLTSLSKLLHEILHAPPPRLTVPGVPAWLADAIHRCLEKDPARRFQTGADLARVLREQAAPQAAARPQAEAPTGATNGHALPQQATAPARRTPVVKEAPAPTGATRRRKTKPEARPPRNPAIAPPRQRQPSLLPAPSEAGVQQTPRTPPAKRPDVKPARPRARTAFKVWLLLGLLLAAYVVFVAWPVDGKGLARVLLAVNVFSFTPAVSGALATLFAGHKQQRKVGRGIFVGALFGGVCSALASGWLISVDHALGHYAALFEPPAVSLLEQAVVVGGAAALFSATITGLVLNLKFRFSSW